LGPFLQAKWVKGKELVVQRRGRRGGAEGIREIGDWKGGWEAGKGNEVWWAIAELFHSSLNI
jgi:hypothetical protein